MKVLLEFYRTRIADEAHAVIGRELMEVADLKEAIRMARILSVDLNMPQTPDAFVLRDASGNRLYTAVLDAADDSEGDIPR